MYIFLVDETNYIRERPTTIQSKQLMVLLKMFHFYTYSVIIFLSFE